MMSAPGFSYFSACGLGYHNFNNVSITRDTAIPTGGTIPPLVASVADGMHFAHQKVGPTITDARIEFTQDDGIAIHGMFGGIVRVNPTTKQFIVAYGPSCGGTPFSVGDRLNLYKPDKSLGAVVKVTFVALSTFKPTVASKIFTTFDYLASSTETFTVKINSWPKFMNDASLYDVAVYSPDRVGSNFVIDRAVIRYNRARAILLKASNGIVKNSIIEGSTLGGIIAQPEYYWAEAGYVSNTTIQNNTITDVANWKYSSVGALVLTAPSKDQFNNAIIGNTIIRSNTPNLVIAGATNTTLVNNQFVGPVATSSTNGFQCTAGKPLCIDKSLTFGIFTKLN